MDMNTAAGVAAIIAGFGSAVLVFRIQRESDMYKLGERTWIPWADRLLIASVVIALVFVLLPLIVSPATASTRVPLFSRALLAASIILLAGYVFSILAHYRLIFGGEREGPRINPEPAEEAIVNLAIASASIVSITIILLATSVS